MTALVEGADHVCCRYRLTAFGPALQAAGHGLDVCPLPRDWWGRLRLFRMLRGADVVVQRRLLPLWQVAYLRQIVNRLIFDFDDAVFSRDSYHARGVEHAGRLRRFASMVRRSDAVVAGNEFLAERARRWNTAVRVIPTCVDPGRYTPRPALPFKAGLEMVWVGSSSTLQGLERTTALWGELGRSVPGLRLKLVCDRTMRLQNLPVDFKPWTEAGEAADIAAADVGVSWIPDDDWSRGKCGLKVLQYMAAGLPVVANSVGVHREMVRPGETGFLADTPAEWVAAMRRLAVDPTLRRSMGAAGRALVEAKYSVRVGSRLWTSLLDELSARRCRVG